MESPFPFAINSSIGGMAKVKVVRRGILIPVLVLMVFGMVKSDHVSAAGSYMIKVNKQANCVTIYQKDEAGKYQAVKAMICSTGWATELGTYSLGEKYRWHTLDGPCYGQYCTRIYGGVLFHSVWYHRENDPSSLSVSSYNKLGTTASHGCVRLTCADAKWIYDNVPSGTSVVVYSDSDPGPLGKPESISLSGYMGYDPTDIWTSSNPWNNKKPSITLKPGIKKVLDFASDFDVKSCVTAKNTTGFDASKYLKTVIFYGGSRVKRVNTKIPGTYRVTYKLTDEIGRKAKRTVNFRVKAAKATPVISGADKIYIKSRDKLTKARVLKYLTVKQGKKTLDKKYIKVTFKKKNNCYVAKVVAQNASYSAKHKVKVYIDKQKPVFDGITDQEVRYVLRGTLVDDKYCLMGVTVSDNYSELSLDDVAVTVRVNDDDTGYTVVYKVTDEAGNTRKITVYYLYSDGTSTEPVWPATGGAVTA